MSTSAILIFVMVLTHHWHIGLSQSNTTRWMSSAQPRTAQERPSTASTSIILTDPIPLVNSDCLCFYDSMTNSLICTPPSVVEFLPSSPLPSTDRPSINVALNGCQFLNNIVKLPMIGRRSIDHLRLNNINAQGYLLFDSSSFASSSISHITISYTSTDPVSILLLSNDTFAPLSSSLRTLYIDSCYLITLYRPFRQLTSLQSISFVTVDQYSWSDFYQDIVSLPVLGQVFITDRLFSTTGPFMNAVSVSCSNLAPSWILNDRTGQTCDCTFVSMLRAENSLQDIFKCSDSNDTMNLLGLICRLQKRGPLALNRISPSCRKCPSDACSSGAPCTPASPSQPTCIPPRKYDLAAMRQRIPLTSSTRRFLLNGTEQTNTSNASGPLEPSGFLSLATMLSGLNPSLAASAPTDPQLFHQMLLEMLSRPWSPSIYSSSVSLHDSWQSVFVSLDNTVKEINDSDPRFEFQSQVLSTVSVRFATDQQLQSTFGWKVNNDNRVIANASDWTETNISSRIFLRFSADDQQFKPKCKNPYVSTD